MIWNCTFDGQTPSEVRYWATWTHPVDSDISECVYLQWKSTRSRCAGINSLERQMGPWLKQLILYYTQEPSDSLTLEWKSTCLQTVSRGTRDISLILHGHQNAPRSHGSIFIVTLSRKENPVIIYSFSCRSKPAWLSSVEHKKEKHWERLLFSNKYFNSKVLVLQNDKKKLHKRSP